MKKLILLILVIFSIVTNAQVVINADVADNNIKNNFSSLDGESKEFTRVNYNADVCYVIPFQIPDIPKGSFIETASFTFNKKTSIGSGGINIDLYGLGYRSSANIDLTNDYFAGSDDANADKLETSIIVNSTSNGEIRTNTTGSVNLANYINKQLEGGASYGDYIFLRLSPAKTGGYDTYTIYSANSSVNVPTLTLTLTYGVTDDPKFNTKLTNQIINEGATENLDVSATDPNGDNLTFTPSNLPSFAVLTQDVNGTASIAVSPQVGDAGSYNDITITVSDGTYSDVQTFNITVKDPNENYAPIIEPIANETIEENQTKKISISVFDADEDNIIISVNNKPSFAILNQISNGVAELVLNPTSEDVGNYIDVEITANDGKVIVSDKFNIEVTAEQVVVGNSYYCDPVNGSMSNDGLSKQTPWKSLQEVFAAKKHFNPGDVIFLMSGAHGQPYINGNNSGNGSSDGYISIRGLQGETPYLSSVQLGDGSYYSFQDITFTSDGRGGSFSRGYMLISSNTFTHLKVVNCSFNSGEDSSTWSKADWYSYSKDAVMVKGDNLIFNNNTLTNVYFALQMEADYAEVKNNIIDNFGADAIRALGSNAIYENNLIRDAYIEDYGVNHDDAIQLYDRGNVASGLIENVIIKNNKIYSFADTITDAMKADNLIGYSMQGIMHTDSHVKNVVIENNLTVTDHFHGITLGSAVDCRIQNNTVLKTPNSVNPDDSALPWIQVRDAKNIGEPTGNTIRNNISHKITTWTYDLTKNTTENNIQTEISDYSDLFIDYSNYDMHLKDGSSAIDAGVNTDLAATDIEGNSRLVGFTVDCGAYEVQVDEDEVSPTLSKANDTYIDDEVVIKFSESVTKTTAENTGNYSIDGGVNIISATLNSDAITVVLEISELSGNNLYTVTANNVEDFAGNKSANTTATFTYLCGTISASSYQDDQWGTNPPEDAFDGDMNTKWAANGDGEWIVKNYCENQLFNNISIAFGFGDQRVYYFTIEVSSDGINYTEIYSGQSSGTTLNLESFDVENIEGKYLKIIGAGNNATTDDGAQNMWNNYVEITIDSETVPHDTNLYNENVSLRSVQVYPNPIVGTSFSVSIPQDIMGKGVNIKLYNLNGLEVYSNKITTREYKFILNNKTTTGIYFLLISNNKFNILKKLVVK